MSSYQEKAQEAGGKMEKLDLAVKFLSEGKKVELHQVDDHAIKGIAHGTKNYKFVVNLEDMQQSKCLCGYYLPDKNGGTFSPDKLCTHQLAGLIEADNGAITVAIPTTTRAPRQPKTQTINTAQPTTGQYSFKAKIGRAISSAIEDINETVKVILSKNKHPCLVGPTGCGKTSAVEMLIDDNDFWISFFKDKRGTVPDQFLPGGSGMLYQTIGGMESYGDADIVGLLTQVKEVMGIIARSFKLAREGNIVVIFCDEFKRFDKRVQNLFMLALLPKSASAALKMSIVTDKPIYMTEAPVWGVEWAPVENIIWIFGTNEWGSTIDSAFARRVQAFFIGYSEKVLSPLDPDMADFIRQTWQLTDAGTLPLPIEYGMISNMRNGHDLSAIPDYLSNLRLIDPGLQLMIANMVPDHLMNKKGQSSGPVSPDPAVVVQPAV